MSAVTRHDIVNTSRQAEEAGARFKNQRLQVGDAHVGPLAHLATEREYLRSLTWAHFTVKPLGATVGAIIGGIDITKPLSDTVIDEIRRVLAAYKVIFFRDQPLTPQQHVDFARRFGELELHPFLASNGDMPELVRFTKSAEVGGYENLWHHDVTWREVPSMGAVLHAVQVPESGGDTLFCDMYAAYDGLPDDVKERIDTMTATHDFMPSFGKNVKDPDMLARMRIEYPIQHHPVAPTHPVTGRRYLYVNRNFCTGFDGLAEEEGMKLREYLCRQSDTLEFQCRFHWEKDSVAFWDNHAVQHYAASDYWPDVRIMERASIVGHRPFQ